ncbi:MAG TPA: hypothetical protein VF058_10870 [Actinomycetota bacterium]
MRRRDENDLTDEEFLELWEQGEPVELAPPREAPSSTSDAEEASPPTSGRRRAGEHHRDA